MQVVFPAALPQILHRITGRAAVDADRRRVAENADGRLWLGGAMMTASRFANSVGVFAGIVEIAVIGYVMVKSMSMIRRRL